MGLRWDVSGKAVGNKASVEGDVEEQGEQQDVEEDVEEVGEQQDVAFVGKAGEEDDAFVVDAGNEGVIGAEQEGVGVKHGKGGEEYEAVVEGVKASGSTTIKDSGEKFILDLKQYPSPSVCFIDQNFPSSVVELTEVDPSVEYKDYDKRRGRKRSRYLNSPYTDLMPKRTKKSKSNEEDIVLVEFTSFLKNDDHVSFYTGQLIPMTRQHFQGLVNVEK